jgi:hypothetical protein
MTTRPTREEIAEIVARAMSFGALYFDHEENPKLWKDGLYRHADELLALFPTPAEPLADQGGGGWD